MANFVPARDHARRCGDSQANVGVSTWDGSQQASKHEDKEAGDQPSSA